MTDATWERNRYYRWGHPDHWVVYVVSNIRGQSHPLAAFCHATGGERCLKITAGTIPEIILGISSVFSVTSYHRNILSEVDAAHAAFAVPPSSPDPRPLALPRRQRKSPWDGMGREFLVSAYGTNNCLFPFISTLLLRAIQGQFGFHQDCWTALPLDRVYDGRDSNYGALVIDISDLSSIKYGIAASKASSYTKARPPDASGGPVPAAVPDIVWMVDEPKRVLQSVEQYLDYFETRQSVQAGVLQRIATISVADPRALDVIWPSGKNHPCSKNALKSLTALSAEALVRATKKTGKVDPAVLDLIRSLPGVKEELRKQLKIHTTTENPTPLLTALLPIAFEKIDHISFARIRGLTFDAFAQALSTDELQNAKTIDFCINTVKGDSLDEFFLSLCKMPNLKSVYMMSQPGAPNRSDDVRGDHIWALEQLLSSAYFPKLRAKFLSSGLYAASIQGQQLLSGHLASRPALCPVASLFCRHQSHASDPGAFYQGIDYDNLILDPERLVAQLCDWIRHTRPEGWVGAKTTTDRLPYSSDDSVLLPPPTRATDWPDKYLDRPEDVLGGRWVVLLWHMDSQAREYQYCFVRRRPDGEEPRWLAVGAEEFLALTAPESDTSWVSEKLSNAGMVAVKPAATGNVFEEFFQFTRRLGPIPTTPWSRSMFDPVANTMRGI